MKIIIVEHRFHYSGPVAQRLLGYAKKFIQEGNEVVMIISSQTPFDKTIIPAKFIEIQETKGRMIKCYYNFVKTIKAEYTKNSMILFYEPSIYAFLFSSSHYNVFSEQTEIPNYGYKRNVQQYIFDKIKMYAIRHFDGMLVISKALMQYYRERDVKNVEVVNMFVDTSRFDNLEIKKDTNEYKYIAYCGTISVHKDGVDILIKAFNIFHQKYPDYKLLLIGDFDKLGSEEVCRTLIQKMNLESSVVLKGRVNANEMPALLKGAYMLVLSRPNNTQSQYGFPTKLGEYLATGKPVVVTEVGEIPLYLSDGKNAFLCKPNDYSAFATKMIQVMDNYPLSLAIAEQGKMLVSDVFSSEIQAEKALSFFNTAINIKNK